MSRANTDYVEVICKNLESIESCGELVLSRSTDTVERIDISISGDSDSVDQSWYEYWDKKLDRFIYRRQITETKIFRLRNCIIVPPEMFIVTEDGTLIKESIRKIMYVENSSLTGNLFSKWRGGEPDPIRCKRESGRYFLFSSSQDNNYYHFMVENLPKLTFMADESVKGATMMAPTLESAFHARAIALAGGDIANFYQISEPTLVDELFFCEPLAPSNISLSGEIRHFYRGRYGCMLVKGDSAIADRRIYVSRGDASVRRVLNEDEVMATLERYGFECLNFSDKSMDFQFQTFAQSSFVIGPHGAGLSNIMFCPEHAKVIEIVPSSFREGATSYAALSELFGLDYAMFVARAGGAGRGANSDMSVDVRQLEMALRRML